MTINQNFGTNEPTDKTQTIMSLPRLYLDHCEKNERLLFVNPEHYGAFWQSILDEAAIWQTVDTTLYLALFCGVSTRALNVSTMISGLHHVAFYLGDYTDDEQIFSWFRWLQKIEGTPQGPITVEMGPSYIAPKQYGTPGWWYSLTFPDGFVIEMFSCRQFSSWPQRSSTERINLMSHIAVQIGSESMVKQALDTLCGLGSHLENIAFIESDEMGHTYGHIRNNNTKQVVELVYQAPLCTEEAP